MEKLQNFHKNGFLIPIENPKLTKIDHYDNMSSDFYRQVPHIINLRLQQLTRQQYRSIFKYVSKHIFVDVDTFTPTLDNRAHVLRFRNIPRDVRVSLDKVLQDVQDFNQTGLLVPINNQKLLKRDHFRNLMKTQERKVPDRIFRRLFKKSRNEIISLFPRAAGTLVIKPEPVSKRIISVDKSNIVYINSLKLTAKLNHDIESRNDSTKGYNGVDPRHIILNYIPEPLHGTWFNLLSEIRRFFQVGLLIPTCDNTLIPEHQRFRNFNPNGYRHVPPLLYDRIERILNSIPNRRQLKALFPNTNGTIYLNTEPINHN
jgi:hypothetical protein